MQARLVPRPGGFIAVFQQHANEGLANPLPGQDRGQKVDPNRDEEERAEGQGSHDVPESRGTFCERNCAVCHSSSTVFQETLVMGDQRFRQG